jgi:hypothetical protein
LANAVTSEWFLHALTFTGTSALLQGQSRCDKIADARPSRLEIGLAKRWEGQASA